MSGRSPRGVRGPAVALALALTAVLLAACAPAEGNTAQDRSVRLALLLPENKTARYEAHDRPAFVARVEELCPECRTLVSNAGQDASRQQAQAEAAITNGADVLVLDPVDSVSAAVIAGHAARAGVPVVSYDRAVVGAQVDFHVTFDNERVGEMQAQALRRALRGRADEGVIVALNGAPTDDNAAQFRRGARRVFDGSELTVARELDVPDWSPDQARELMEQALASLGRDRVIGVYAANDGIAAGAIAAMRSAGLDPLPPVTGQDAELAAIRRILAGEQHMTVYKALRTQARAAAEIALGLARTGRVPDGVRTGWVDHGAGEVPVLVLEPQPVTRETIDDTVLRDGFWTVEQVCGDGLEEACRQLGIEVEGS